MKAILITFNASFTDVQASDVLLNRIRNLITDHTKRTETNTCTISLLSDEEVHQIVSTSTVAAACAQCLKAESANSSLSNRPLTQQEKEIIHVCKRIVSTIGQPSDTDSSFEFNLIANIANGSFAGYPGIKHIAKITNSPVYEQQRLILAAHGLDCLPEILKKIKSTVTGIL